MLLLHGLDKRGPESVGPMDLQQLMESNRAVEAMGVRVLKTPVTTRDFV